MKRALLPLMLAGSSCSLLFDPSKVGSDGGSGGDASTCSAPTAATYLEAVAGEAADRLTWRWDATPGAYQFCGQNVGGTAVCVDVTCAGGPCEYSQTGLLAGVRVVGTVAPRDSCAGPLAVSATSTAMPIDVTNMSAWRTDTTPQCNNFVADVNSGQVSIDQQGLFCQSAFVTGDEELGDLTLDFDIRVSASASGVRAGAVIQSDGSGHRLRLMAVVNPDNVAPLEFSERPNGSTAEAVVANGIGALETADWVKVRVTVVGRTVSWQQGPVNGTLSEIVRWTNVVDPAPHKGRIGFGANGQGHFDVRNVRVTNRATQLQAPTSVTYDFGLDGGPAGSRVVSVPVVVIPCPGFLDCSGGGCAPPANSNCGVVRRVGLGYTQIALPPPHGLDPNRDWELSLRFAIVPDGGVTGSRLLEAVPGQLIDVNQTDTALAGWQVTPRRTLDDYGWHLVTLRFPGDGGLITGTIDGMSYTTTSPTPANHTLEAVRLGNGLNSNGFVVHQLTIRQP